MRPRVWSPLLATSSRPFDGDEGATKAAVNNPAKVSVNGRKLVTSVPLYFLSFNFSRHTIAVRSSKLTSRFVAFLLPSSPNVGARVAAVTGNVHTPTMTLKTAALLALIGTVLMTALLVWNFVLTFLNVLRDLVPAVTLFSTFIYAFGCFSVMVFFFVFHRTHS
jgi:hypothetical protein